MPLTYNREYQREYQRKLVREKREAQTASTFAPMSEAVGQQSESGCSMNL